MKRHSQELQYQPGLAPGTIRERPAGPIEELDISIIDYTPSTTDVREHASVDEITPANPDTNRWIRVRGTPTTELLHQIGRAFSVHNLILEDISSSEQRIKVEDYDNLMFTVLRTLRDTENGEHEELELSVVLTGTTLITVYEGTDPTFFTPILARLENPDSLLRHHKVDFLYHAIVDITVDCFFPVIQQLEARAAELETAILDNASQEQLRAIHVLRQSSQQLRGILWSTRDVISRVERSTHRFIDSETLFYFRDIHDHVVHVLDAVSALRDAANGLMELYMSGVSNRMNEVMKVLTVISTVFIPGTFIAGVYGMNFEHMPELSARWAYPAVLGVMALIGIGMLIYFKRRKWY